jgi:two-component system sensor histidine kinase KdpD
MVVGFCTVLAVFLRSRVAITNVAMLYLLGVIVVSITCHRGAAVLNALLAVTSFYYFCVPPWNSFVIEDYSYIIILVTTLTVALVLTTLTIKIRAQADHALEREARMRATYQLSRDLSADTTVLAAARTAVRTVSGIFSARVDLFLPDEQRAIALRVDETEVAPVSDSDRAGVQSILDSGKKFTELIPSGARPAMRVRMPLVCGGSAVAVLILTPDDRDRFSDPDQMHFLEALCDLIAAAIDRLRSSAAIREAEAEIQAERTRNALLNAVSHDIKTPLASIYGAATSLLEEEHRLSPEDRHDLVESISDEAERLNRVVNNLLEMTSLDSGLRAKKDWRPLEEIIGAALARLEKPLRDRSVATHIDEDLPWIFVDDVLIELVFVNILENAVKYTPAGAAITIAAHREGDRAVISISDHGAGLAPEEMNHVFEKFFRGKTVGVRGVGLGLAICRAIVLGHDGSIVAGNSPEGGAVFRFELPIGGTPPEIDVIPETTLS